MYFDFKMRLLLFRHYFLLNFNFFSICAIPSPRKYINYLQIFNFHNLSQPATYFSLFFKILPPQQWRVNKTHISCEFVFIEHFFCYSTRVLKNFIDTFHLPHNAWLLQPERNNGVTLYRHTNFRNL